MKIDCQEYSESPTDKKSSTPEVVDLDSDDDETAVSPAKKPMPRDILMTYKCTTIHFEDMKGLFFDEMVACYFTILMTMLIILGERYNR